MPRTRLHINLAEGIIEAEGDPDFVRQVYADFKDKVSEAIGASERAMPHPEERDGPPRKRKPR